MCIPLQVLWWMKCHLYKLLSEYVRLPLSLSLHHCSIFICLLLWPEEQRVEFWESSRKKCSFRNFGTLCTLRGLNILHCVPTNIALGETPFATLPVCTVPNFNKGIRGIYKTMQCDENNVLLNINLNLKMRRHHSYVMCSKMATLNPSHA
jgi:hypothetical protein